MKTFLVRATLGIIILEIWNWVRNQPEVQEVQDGPRTMGEALKEARENRLYH